MVDKLKQTHVKVDALSKVTATYLINLGYTHNGDYEWYHPDFDTYVRYDRNFNPIPTKGAVKSDGGSSSYYTLNINGNKVETEDIIDQVFGNDFDFGNAFKSLVRAYQTTQGGGKAGNDVAYEMNKIQYSTNKIKGRK